MTFIAVGGPTGVGKTTIINELLKKHSRYFRPKAYTNRPSRNRSESDQFTFSTESEILSMSKEGKLLTLDIVHGYYYGLDQDYLFEVQSNGLDAIKEYYYQNHLELKKSLQNVVSVIIMPKSLECYRSHLNQDENIRKRVIGRSNEEFEEHYEFLKNKLNDITIFNDFSDSIETIATNLHLKLSLMV